MRLYKAELYKICHKKAVFLSLIATFIIMLLYFSLVCAGEEIATVNGEKHVAFEAIRINREITEEFKGILTDEKAVEIIQKYGFPKTIEENFPGFRDANFLNGFVAEYLSNGHMYDWDNYRMPTKVISLENSELGKLLENRKQPLTFAYTNGWDAFADTMQMGMVLASIAVIIAISGIFSEENRCKMLPLLFTTEKGKKQCISAKIFAAFTFTILLYMSIVLVNFLCTIFLYGTDGLECVMGMLKSGYMNNPVTHLTIGKYLLVIQAFSFLGILSLCAMTLFISAKCNTSFHALALAFICWGIPVILRIFLGGFAYLLISATPIFLVMRNLVYDIYEVWFIPTGIAAAGSIFFTIRGYTAFKNI